MSCKAPITRGSGPSERPGSSCPPHDLPDGPGTAATRYGAVAERAQAAVAAAVPAGRFPPEDVRALHTVAQAAGTHSVRLSATQPGTAAGQRVAAGPQAAAPAPRVATSPPAAPRSPRLAT